MPTYTRKIVNGVVMSTTAGDVTVLNARDAANLDPGHEPAVTAAQKVERLAKTYGLTLAQLKSELG